MMREMAALDRTVLAVVMVMHVLILTSYFVSLEFIDRTDVKDANNQNVEYTHPVFLVVCGFSMEFVIIVCLYWPLEMFTRKTVVISPPKFVNFMIPATCDFIDKISLVIGLHLVSANLSGTIRALVPITTAFLSVYIF